ncbi:MULTISPECIES: stage II sporulation protein M [Sphingobacterium]|uniref:Stage II sporulation protein M n=1 Tax=Sphingobacterium litopenaei TaxID=2763500 RepID=A0ABR7YDB7_9SPHI|nr:MULTISPECIES: stage II sporulation protein M [Sphingobacterium]MBD1429302.1 stage II sporulation protein M [Sphingobacterium litopenaei]NGM73582.1 stage II sporulation protein M [Sphingobacterium sp. SGL-16]
MREASFIERNKEKWLLIENNLLNIVNVDPDILASNYIELTNDLAYAQTFYPQSKTKDYLNELSIRAHQLIYKDQKSSSNKLSHFFTYEIFESIWKIRKQLVYSLLIFLLANVIGFISAHYEESFLKFIMGSHYVDMTVQNIKEGNPAGVYQQGSNWGGALAITINNVQVAFFAFIYGIFFSLGTGYILMMNGIMVGTFHYLFFKYNVLSEAMTAIWIHGTIELSVIVIAGGCGLAMGNSILFPKSYTRLESFKRTVKHAAKVLISTIPFFIMAGTLEGYVTRYYQVSVWMCLIIIAISLLSIVYVYIVKPKQMALKYGWDK